MHGVGTHERRTMSSMHGVGTHDKDRTVSSEHETIDKVDEIRQQKEGHNEYG